MIKKLDFLTNKFYHYLSLRFSPFLVVVVLFFLIRIIGLGTDISNSDALRWHRRSENFLTAIKTLNFVETYQHYQPGVTLMWVNSVVKQSLFWLQLLYTTTPLTTENSEWFPIVDGVSKLSLIFIYAILLIVQVKCIEKIFSKKVALFFGFFVSLEPYLIGIDRWFHLTSLEAYFAFTAFIVMLYALKKIEATSDNTQTNKLIFISAFLFVLGFLSKITAIVLFPLFVFIIFKFKNKRSLILYLLSCIFFTTILFPALLVDPLLVFKEIANAVVGGVANTVRTESLEINTYLFYFYILTFKLSPVTLLVLLFGIPKIKKFSTDFKYFKYVATYFFIYFLALLFSGQKIDRYIVPLILPLLLYVALVVSYLRLSKQLLLMAFVFLNISFTVWNYYPVYSAFYSPVLGGTKKAIDTGVYDNSGEYYAQASLYLKTLGREKRVYVPNNFESFSPYYDGVMQREIRENTNFVVTSLDYDRRIPTVPYTNCANPINSFGPKDFKVVYIYECN